MQVYGGSPDLQHLWNKLSVKLNGYGMQCPEDEGNTKANLSVKHNGYGLHRQVECRGGGPASLVCRRTARWTGKEGPGKGLEGGYYRLTLRDLCAAT